jgi:predicted dehydrogenase
MSYEHVGPPRYARILCERGQAMDSTLGVGIIGYGYSGRMHACAYANLPFYYDIRVRPQCIGVCTARPETALDALEHAGFAFSTTDPMDIVARPDISVVHICTPNDTHHGYARAALAAGKHVYCEKPLATTLTEAREMADAADNSGCVHQVAFPYRFVPAITRARQLVEEGVLGDPISFRVAYLHSGYVNPNRPMTWRLDKTRAGGGALFDLGSHAIDLVRHLLGDVARVSAVLHTFVTSRPAKEGSEQRVPVEVDDLALLQMHMENGAYGTLEASRVAAGATDDLVLDIRGSRGALHFSLMDPNWLHVFDARAEHEPIGGRQGYTRVATLQRYPYPAVFPDPRATVGWARFHLASIFDFVSNIVAGTVGSPSFADGLAVQAVLDAAQRSHEQGAWVDVEHG